MSGNLEAEEFKPKTGDQLSPEWAATVEGLRALMETHFPLGFLRPDGTKIDPPNMDFLVFDDQLDAPVILAVPGGEWENSVRYEIDAEESAPDWLVIKDRAFDYSYSIELETNEHFVGARYSMDGCSLLYIPSKGAPQRASPFRHYGALAVFFIGFRENPGKGKEKQYKFGKSGFLVQSASVLTETPSELNQQI